MVLSDLVIGHASVFDMFLSGAWETMLGPSALLPAQLAVVAVAACWIAWVDLHHGIIPDLGVGVVLGIALARLAPFGASAMVGGALVGACTVAGLTVISHAAAGLNWALGAQARDGGAGRLGSGDVRFVAACTMLLGVQGTATALVVTALLVAGHTGAQMRYAGRPLREALLLPVRLGPHLGCGLVFATAIAALRW